MTGRRARPRCDLSARYHEHVLGRTPAPTRWRLPGHPSPALLPSTTTTGRSRGSRSQIRDSAGVERSHVPGDGGEHRADDRCLPWSSDAFCASAIDSGHANRSLRGARMRPILKIPASAGITEQTGTLSRPRARISPRRGAQPWVLADDDVRTPRTAIVRRRSSSNRSGRVRAVRPRARTWTRGVRGTSGSSDQSRRPRSTSRAPRRSRPNRGPVTDRSVQDSTRSNLRMVAKALSQRARGGGASRHRCPRTERALACPSEGPGGFG